MQGILYEEPSALQFIFITVILGGWTAWRTGKASAETWSSLRVLAFYTLLLGVAVRFLHFALFGGTFLSAQYYLVDTVILAAFSFAAYRHTRTNQMTSKYYWLYQKTSPFSWAEK